MPIEQLGIQPTALPDHVAAHERFAQLAATDPALALAALKMHANEERPEAITVAERDAIGTIATFLNSGADLYTIFGKDVEADCESERRTWEEANWASYTSDSQDETAKTAWRRARISAYLARSCAIIMTDANPQVRRRAPAKKAA